MTDAKYSLRERLHRFWHREITFTPTPCGDATCTLKVCVRAQQSHSATQRARVMQWARTQQGWSEVGMVLHRPGMRPVTFEQLLEEWGADRV